MRKKALKTKAVEALNGLFSQIRVEHRQGMQGTRWQYEDPLADLRVWTDPKDIEKMSGSKSALVYVAFDGGAYAYLSTEGDYPTLAERRREALREKLESLGLHVEDHNSWSFAVYES